jgi:hypothetical protein
MVKIRDITSERAEQKRRHLLEKKLLEESFSGKEFKTSDFTELSLHIRYHGVLIASKPIGTIKLILYNPDFLPQARQFSEKYQKEFGINHFIIETDYS